MNEVIEKPKADVNLSQLKNHFPVLRQYINNNPLVYLDNAATTQKPNFVLDAIMHYYQHDNANIHRGVHTLSVRATNSFEKSREIIKDFINAKHSHEIIFTKGATDGINMIAALFGRSQLKKGDEIILSELEHHSNIVPWQMVRDQIGIEIKIIPVMDSGELDLDAYQKLFTKNTKMVSISHASNAIGTINPIRKMIVLAHEHNVPVMIDGAQAVPHLTVDVQELDCDFYVFSSHKMYGPTGVGVLYAKSHWLEQLPPYQGGGDMITQVTFEKSIYNKLPHKFEAGTPNIADVIGLASAISFLQEIGMATIQSHEEKLLAVATEHLSKIPGLKIIGTATHKAPVLSFTLKDIHPHDIGTVLDHEGVAIRAGHHCAMPLMDRFKVPATARASFALYNTVDDVEALNEALLKLIRLFDNV